MADEADLGVESFEAAATLAFGGLRIDELCGLRWRHVDLAAGLRHVDLLPCWATSRGRGRRARPAPGRPADYVFATRSGGRPSKDNLRSRVVMVTVARANETLEADGLPPLPGGPTPHGLRHTFASILVALGEDPRYVMEQIGHTDPAFTQEAQ